MKCSVLWLVAATLLCVACTQTHGVSLGSAAAKPSDDDAGTDDGDDDDDDPRHEEGEHRDGIFSDDGASIVASEPTAVDAGEVETED